MFSINVKMVKKILFLHQKLTKENQNQNLKKAMQKEYIEEEKRLLKLKKKKKT